RTDPTGHKYSYTYDAHGNLTQIMDQALSTHVDFGPDGAGRVLWKTDPYSTLSSALHTSVRTDYTYDGNDNVTSVQIGTNPAPGVIATSPSTAPVTAPTTVGFPCFTTSINIQESIANAADVLVVIKA
ncbi:MAG: RHS repeat protein, partial [Clostridiales bacterium]|nr:RHS repeat protein [Clostridiales bacterium]